MMTSSWKKTTSNQTEKKKKTRLTNDPLSIFVGEMVSLTSHPRFRKTSVWILVVGAASASATATSGSRKLWEIKGHLIEKIFVILECWSVSQKKKIREKAGWPQKKKANQILLLHTIICVIANSWAI